MSDTFRLGRPGSVFLAEVVAQRRVRRELYVLLAARNVVRPRRCEASARLEMALQVRWNNLQLDLVYILL